MVMFSKTPRRRWDARGKKEGREGRGKGGLGRWVMGCLVNGLFYFVHVLLFLFFINFKTAEQTEPNFVKLLNRLNLIL